MGKQYCLAGVVWIYIILKLRGGEMKIQEIRAKAKALGLRKTIGVTKPN